MNYFGDSLRVCGCGDFLDAPLNDFGITNDILNSPKQSKS
jgi:hypothetical protein